METEITDKFRYNEIPKQVSRKDFNKYIDPHLKKPKKGPKPKISLDFILQNIQLHPVCFTYWNTMGSTQDKA